MRWVIRAILLGTLSITLSAWGVDVIARPNVATKNCTEAGCHAKERDYKVLHGPTALGACDACHQPADVAKHTFNLKGEGKNLCSFCHVEQKGGAVLHKPVADGKCLSCHNPHGSSNKLLLRKDDLGSQCMECHKDVTGNRQHLHGPVASGSCTACHNAHSADLPKLLVAQGRDLCLGCHDQMASSLKTAKVVHKPLEGNCTQCHEVHASNYAMQLKAPTLDLCESCHTEVKKQVATAKFKHSAVEQGEACLNCHTPHGGAMAKLTRDDLGKACMTCHDKALTTADKRPVPAVTEVLDKTLSQHGPIRDGNCSGCHSLHGSQVSRLLAKPYPETFYAPFNLDDYGLCFSCHDKALVLQPKTTGLTRFRNGEENLHFVHVNRPDKGRSCRACHATHASTHSAHVRDSVPYGKWELPINFKPTETGGSCTPGCHKEAPYDREKPAPMLNPPNVPAPGTLSRQLETTKR
jgi:predicted CXXCH cytochrome family protein